MSLFSSEVMPVCLYVQKNRQTNIVQTDKICSSVLMSKKSIQVRSTPIKHGGHVCMSKKTDRHTLRRQTKYVLLFLCLKKSVLVSKKRLMFLCQKTSGEGQLCIVHFALKKFLCLNPAMGEINGIFLRKSVTRHFIFQKTDY